MYMYMCVCVCVCDISRLRVNVTMAINEGLSTYFKKWLLPLVRRYSRVCREDMRTLKIKSDVSRPTLTPAVRQI